MEWELTPPAVQDDRKHQHQQIAQFQAQRARLQPQVAPRQGRVEPTSHPSRQPPSSDCPFNKPQRHKRTASGPRGGHKGHRGNGPTLLSPPEVPLLEPGPCACGHSPWGSLSPSHTHHVIALPPIERASHHGVLQHGPCQRGGRPRTAQGPPAHHAGSGPRLPALIGARAGIPRTSWRLVHACWHSVLPIPLSLGAVHTVITRLSQALVPHDEAMATLARQAPGGSIEATPGDCPNALQGLWTRTTDTVALSLLHPNRSTDALLALMEEWQGLLVSDGDGVSQRWGAARQTCVAHLLRRARGLSQKRAAQLAACGPWALKEVQALCHLAKAPPSGGEGSAWSARLCRLLNRSHERLDDAGRLTRRVQRERASLWVCLRAQGGAPPHNRAERSLRFAVMGRKGSSGTDSEAGHRWVERTFSLRQTCRQLGQSTFGALVDAVTSFFQGRQPDRAWLYCKARHASPFTL